MHDASKGEKRTLVEEGTELRGTLKSACPVVVNGTIDGEITAPALTITRTGSVLGTVKAAELRSDGTLAGNIDAEHVYLSGTVRDNTVLRAKSLEVKLHSDRGKLEVSFGECVLDVGDQPAAREEATPALAAPEAPLVTLPAPDERAAAAAPPELGSRRRTSRPPSMNGNRPSRPPVAPASEWPNGSADPAAHKGN